MFKHIWAFFFAFVLLGCGSGGSETSSSNSNAGNGSGTPSTPSVVAAETILPVESELLTSLLFVLPELTEPKVIYAQVYQSGWFPCIALPDSELYKTISRVRRLNLNNCDAHGMKISGDVESIEKLDVAATSYQINYNNIELRSGTKTFRVSGITKIEGTLDTSSQSCETKTQLTHNLRVQSSTGTVTVDNVVVTVDGGGSYFCKKPQIIVSGSFTHSKTGRYELRTETPLSIYRQPGEDGSHGSVVLQAAKQLLRFELNKNSYALTSKIVISDSSNKPLFTMHTPISISSPPLFSDLSDSDGDGLPNSYELSIGLNPNNPADALLDTDGDGYTNLDEFKYAGHPLDSKFTPESVLAGFSKTERPNLRFMSNDFTIALPYNVNFTRPQTKTTIHAKATLIGDMQFKPKENCILSNNNSIISCNFFYDYSRTYGMHFDVTTDSYDYKEVKASIRVETSSSQPDLSQGDDEFVGDIVRQSYTFTPNFDIYVQYKNGLYTPNRAFTMVKDEPIVLTLNANFRFGDAPIHGYLTPTFPPDIEQQKLECFKKQSSTWQPCSRMAFNDSTKFRLTLVGRKSGFYDLSFDLSIDDRNPAIADKFKMKATVGDSTVLLQQQVDQTSNGGTLKVPAGIYVGTLDLSAKTIQLVADGVVYLVDTVSNVNANSHDKSGNSLLLDYQSTVQGFVVANHSIYISEYGGRLIDNKFGDIRYGLLQNTVISRGDSIIQRNITDTLSNVPDLGYLIGSTCPTFWLGNNSSTTQLNIAFAQNVIHAPAHCGNILRIFQTVKMSMVHNTIFENIQLFKFETLHLKSKHQIAMDNNLFVRDLPFFELESYASSVSGNDMSANNNLLHDVPAEVLGYTYPHIKVTGSMIGDPKLVEVYKLDKGSAAIDKAVPSTNLPVAVDLPPAVDGNGDGDIKHDIGAFEYQP